MHTRPVLENGEVPSIKMIREALRHNPPGQGVIGLDIEYAHDAGFYIAYLLARLEPARGHSIKERMDRVIMESKRDYFAMQESHGRAAAMPEVIQPAAT